MKTLYPYAKQKTVINISKVITFHYHEVDTRFEFLGEKHDFWELVYIDSGSVEIKRDGEPVILNQGEIIFHKPNEFHTIKSNNSSPNIVVISFECKSSAMVCFERYKGTLDKRLKPILTSIVHEAESTFFIPKNEIRTIPLEKKPTAPLGGEQLIKTYLELFLITLARTIMNKNEVLILPSQEQMERQIVQEIKEYLKKNIAGKIKIEDVCHTIGYSKTYLCQLFKAQTSQSIMSYYNVQKIEYAKKLIRDSGHNITQISNMLSFDNPQYFSRVFKRVSGMTPTEFVNSLDIKPMKMQSYVDRI